MLDINIPSIELWDDINERFLVTNEYNLRLEHSLVSISKWEAKHNKAFLSRNEKTLDETLDYIHCMTITQNVSPVAYKCLSVDNIKTINDYINAPMSATIVNDKDIKNSSSEVVTSELIYYWMITLGIPFECQKWHLNRLLTLIRVCNIKNSPPKKMSRTEIFQRNNALNEARRKKLNSKG